MALAKNKSNAENEMIKLMLLGAVSHAPEDYRKEVESYRKQILEAHEASADKEKFSIGLTLAYLEICGEA